MDWIINDKINKLFINIQQSELIDMIYHMNDLQLKLI